MWDRIDKEVGEMLEGEMREVFWKEMLDKGSSTRRHWNTRTSAWKILQPLIESIHPRRTLLLQKEIVFMKKPLWDTSAGCLFFEMGTAGVSTEGSFNEVDQELKDRYPMENYRFGEHDRRTEETSDSRPSWKKRLTKLFTSEAVVQIM